MGARRLLTGPVGPGSTFTVLDAAAAAARAGRPYALVLPTRAAQEHARNELARRAGGCDPDAAFTLVGLARKLVGHGASRVAGPRERDALLVAALAEARAPELDLALRFRGFRQGLLSVFDEVEATNLGPRSLGPALRRARLDEARAARLEGVFESWRKRLGGARLWTEADVLAAATDALARGREAAPVPDLVLVDGFTDFSPRQLALLGAVALKAGEVVVTWPVAAPGATTRAFAGPDRVRARLVRDLAFVEEAAAAIDVEDPRPPVLRRIAEALFERAAGEGEPDEAGADGEVVATPAAAREPVPARGLRVVRAASRRDEVEVALLRARAFVAGEDGDRPRRRWTDALLIVPDARRYRDVVERAARELDVPVRVHAPRPLAGAPLAQGALAFVRAAAGLELGPLLVAAACPAFGLSPDEADRLARAARGRGLPAVGAAPRWQALAGELGGAAGDLVLRALELSRALGDALARDPTTRAACRAARVALERHLRPAGPPLLGDRPSAHEVLDAAAEVAARRELLALLLDLERLAVPLAQLPPASAPDAPAPASAPGAAAPDAPAAGGRLAGLLEPAQAMDSLGRRALVPRLLPPASPPIAPVPPRALVTRLEEEARAAEFVVPDRRRDVLHVVDAREARAWEADLVLVLGLVEGEVPRPARDDLFLPDDARRALSGRRGPGRGGLHLRTARDRAAEDAFLTYAAATRARRELWLLYPGFTASGAPRAASRHLDDLLALLEPEEAARVTWRRAPGDLPGDEPELLPTPALVRRFALRRASQVARARAGDEEARRQALAHALFARLVARPRELERLSVALRRPDATLPEGPGRRVLEHEWSASELEAFAACPFRHFVHHVLRARPKDDLAGSRLDASRQGVVLHTALERVLERQEPVEQAFAAAFAEGARDLELGLEEEAFRRQTLDAVRRFVGEDDPAFRRGTSLVPWRAELSFGERSEVGALEVAAPDLGGTIRLRGSIDRIDLGAPPPAPAPPASASGVARVSVLAAKAASRAAPTTPAGIAASVIAGSANATSPSTVTPSTAAPSTVTPSTAAPSTVTPAPPAGPAAPPARPAGFVTDYKLGGREVDGAYLDGMHKGEKLQLPIYLLALDRVFGIEPLGAAFAALGTRRRTGIVEPAVLGAWERRGLGEDRRVKLHRVPLRRTLERTEEHVRRIVGSVAQGVIAPSPRDASECVQCSAKDVCRVEPWEARRLARRGRALPQVDRPAARAPVDVKPGAPLTPIVER